MNVDFEGEPIRVLGQKLGTLSSHDSSDEENASSHQVPTIERFHMLSRQAILVYHKQ